MGDMGFKSRVVQEQGAITFLILGYDCILKLEPGGTVSRLDESNETKIFMEKLEE